MSATISPPKPASAITPPPAFRGPVPTTGLKLRRFTPAEYATMLTAGILRSGEPVELLEGLIVEKEMRTPLHDAGLDLFRAAFAPFVGPGMLLRSQQAVALPDSTPEPDFSLVRGTPRSFVPRHPVPSDVILVVEIAHSSVAQDRTLMARMYARAAVPAYWIVNVVDSQIEVYSQPRTDLDPPAYTTRTDYRAGDTVPVILDGTQLGTIPAAELLP